MEALTVFLGSIFVVVLVRIPRRMAPTHYFELHEIIHGMNNVVTWQAVAIRFSTPLLVAIAATLALRESQIAVGAGIGFLSSLFLIWPTLLDRRLLPWQAIGRETQTYLLYAMFIASFTLIGLGGGFFGLYLEEPLEKAFSGEGVQKFITEMRSQLDAFFTGLAVLAAGAVLARLWKRLDSWLKREPEYEEDYDES